ncbi:MAG: rhodanese-like domain-containing protein [Bacteroidetes Order II. Incertae sedis bacterium]|nr:rhodanese-like domain-containing protein [Bacteroidetes Order II. bacterium]
MADITVQELKKRMDAGEALTIIDVREPDEYEAANIGATLVPLSSLTDLTVFEPFKEQELIVHCRSGARSGRVVQMLKQAGFNNPRNLIGGMLAWAAEIDPNMNVY